MSEIKTNQQLIIKLRNEVAYRLIGFRASEKYWRNVSKKAKKDSQERVDALNMVAVNQQNISKDENYLKVIDEMLESKKQ